MRRAPVVSSSVVLAIFTVVVILGATGCSAGGPSSLPPGSNFVYAFGDSLTQGSEGKDPGSYPGFLASDVSYKTFNLGVGGQTSSQIAVRENAYAGQSEQTFTSAFTLPTATMTAVAVTFPAGFEPAFNVVDAPSSCTTGAPSPYVGNGPGTSYSTGGVGQDIGVQFKGSDGNTYIGCVWQSSSGVDSMYIANPPAGSVTVAAGTPYTSILPNMQNGCILIQAGRNNYTHPTQVEADLTAMVNEAKTLTTCYGVMDILNGNTSFEWKGAAGFITITGINSWMQTMFGPHHIADREVLVDDYNPSDPRDVIDFGHDVPPTSLRAGGTTGILQAAMMTSTGCNFSFGKTITGGQTVTIGSENVQISGGTDGNYSCTRGYAGTTAATYSTATRWTAIDGLHLGDNQYTASNSHCSNGYHCMAKAMEPNWWQLFEP